MSEKPFSGSIFYYGLDGAQASTVRYTVRMKDPVDGEVLDRAVQKAFTRYPYLKKHLKYEGGSIVIEDNPAPIVVLHTPDTVTLNAPETNGHLIAISWDDCTIWFNNSHGIMDGRGRANVLHTIMYYYCSERYSEDVTMEGVLLAGTPVDPLEYEDPLSPEIRDSDFKMKLKPGLKAMAPGRTLDLLKASGFKRTVKGHTHVVSLHEKGLMRICKLDDATPNTAISLLIMRAVDRLYPEASKSPVAAVCVDMREALGHPKTHLSTTSYGKMIFDREMRGMDFSEQSTILRGQLMLTSSPEAIIPVAKSLRKIMALNCSGICAGIKNSIVKAANAFLRKDASFMVSYSGKSTYGSCDSHIHGFVSTPFVSEANIIVEITVADGLFYICWTQFFEESLFFDEFIAEMELLGLQYKLVDSYVTDGPKMQIQ